MTTADNIAGGNINRMDVTADVTPEKWIDKLVKASPLDPKDAIRSPTATAGPTPTRSRLRW